MPIPLNQAAPLGPHLLLNRDDAPALDTSGPVLVVLAAGKGTRFGREPKCIQPVLGTPLAVHSINAFQPLNAGPAVCLVGYRHDVVSAALGPSNLFVHSSNPAGGTALAAWEAFAAPGLLEANPLLIITMGDRIVPTTIFTRLHQAHTRGTEASLTFLSAIYEPPRNTGKGRVVRKASGSVESIIEERDIALHPDAARLAALTEGNCPLYAIRARTLERHLRDLTNGNAQSQYYLTDIIQSIAAEGGEVRTVTTTPSEPEYDLLCSDVTRPIDLAVLEGVLSRSLAAPGEDAVARVARQIAHGRPRAQILSIARQIGDIAAAIQREKLGFDPSLPIAIGITGGRFRIAFMHPDMVRFYGPAWQLPIGAGSEDGEEQIVVVIQAARDHRIHLFPMDPAYRERVNSLPAQRGFLYPGEEISDWNAYETFGTRLSESALLALGYFSEGELAARREQGLPLPPPALWVSNSMRRPFALVNNAIASIQTHREGNLGARVQAALGPESFTGLRLVSTGSIPQGGFSSSSAVTVATANAINSLYGLGLPPDVLVHLACQAEYGTGVRAGSLDQATEQKGIAGQGTLISSNPRENYRVIGTYPVPTDRIQILFPYSVDRDRAAWRWSGGAYSESTAGAALTSGETRKMTGKAAELAALLTRQPLDPGFPFWVSRTPTVYTNASLPCRS